MPHANEVERNDFVRFRTLFTFDRFVSLPRPGNHRILDFGCGEGHSIEALLDVFPNAHFTGAEFDPGQLARFAARIGNHPRVTLVRMSGPESIEDIGTGFDVIQLNAVFEHLLPAERTTLMPVLWRKLAAGGYLVVTETPWRWFPIETHCTSLPLVNYLPDRLAFFAMRKFGGKRFAKTKTWDDALREGMRGATTREIVASLGAPAGAAKIVQSQAPDARDLLEVWWHGECRKAPKKRFAYNVLRGLRATTGIVVSPWVNVVLQKSQ